MKYILFLAFTLFSLKGICQADTSKQLITLTMKVKHIAFLGDELKAANTLADAPVRDSLIRYIGSGTQPDSIVITKMKAGVTLRLLQAIMRDPTGSGFSLLNEIVTSTQGQGWAGIIPQLTVKKGTVNGEQGVSIWLYNSIITWYNRHQAVLTEKLINGRSWLLNPIDSN